MEPEAVKLLSLDGGGVLGCGPIEFLKPSGLTFDAYAGTSTGSLLVALAVTGHSWQAIDDIWRQWVGPIFPTPSIWRKCNPFLPKYPSDGIEAACRAVFGSTRCNQIATPFFIPVTDIAAGRPKIYGNADPDLLADVVLRSTAAPTYFAPRNSRWVDGGLVANNPSVVGIAGLVRKHGAPLETIRCLSLSTGGNFWKDPQVGARTTLLGWAEPVIEVGLCGTEERDAFVADAILRDRHLRIIPALTRDFEMDDISSMDAYRTIWADLWTAQRADVLAWAA
jgi:patatin-like phospholipase/acyl hydrolase